MFTPHSRPVATGRRTVEMTETPLSGPSTRRPRPGTLLLGKDQPFEQFNDLAVLDDECVLVAGGGPLISSTRGVQLRRWPDLQVEATLPAGGDVFDVLGPSLLASGPLWGGMRQSGVRMELPTGRVRAEYPLHPPFLITEGGFIGWIRQRFDFETEPVVDPALLSPWPELAALFEPRRPFLVSCTWEGKVRWTLDVATFAPEYADVKALARAPEGERFFVGTERSLAELELATGRVHWSQGWNGPPGTSSVAHAAVACDTTRVAIGGWTAGTVSPLRVIDRATARVVFQGGASDISAIESLAFHEGTLRAGTRSGLLLLFDEAYTRREVRLSRASVNQVCVTQGGVLAACNQRELRFLPLLDDE